MLVSKAISAEAKKTLLNGLVIKFSKYEDFSKFFTRSRVLRRPLQIVVSLVEISFVLRS